MKKLYIIVGLLAVLYLIIGLAMRQSSAPAKVAAKTAVVQYVIDGDTIVLETGMHVRLYLVNAPELREPFGNAARDWLDRKIEGKQITLESYGHQSHGRLLAFVYFDGAMVNLELLRAGLARIEILHPEEEKHRAQAFAALREAQHKHKGIWR